MIIGTGSGPILEAATRAFCTAEKGLVTAAPTFTTCEQTARRMGVPVTVVQVNRSLALDTEAMADAAKGAGLVFFCNPNNPTGTVHSAATVEQVVRKIKQSSPGTAILIDEAYIDYVHDPAAKTAAPLTQEMAGVFITRSYSKAHGMAGLRLGYAIGQPDTMQAISRAWGLGSLNALTAAAGQGVLRRLRGQQGACRPRLPAVREDPQPHHARHHGRDEACHRGLPQGAAGVDQDRRCGKVKGEK